MQPVHHFSNSTPRVPERHPKARPGFTLIEILVASVIVAVALMGLISTWFTMLDSTQTTGDRSAGYEIARLVIERARSQGFRVFVDPSRMTTWNDLQLQTVSAPGAGASTAWISPCITHYRFFNAQSQEIGYSIANANPTVPAGTRYLATTTLSAAGNDYVPPLRSDLRLQSLRVDVNLVNPDKSLGPALCDQETILTEGGIQ